MVVGLNSSKHHKASLETAKCIYSFSLIFIEREAMSIPSIPVDTLACISKSNWWFHVVIFRFSLLMWGIFHIYTSKTIATFLKLKQFMRNYTDHPDMHVTIWSYALLELLDENVIFHRANVKVHVPLMSNQKKNSSLRRRPEWIECMFVKHPWSHPRAVALDVKLLHPL